jgi:hypothetical protein
MSDFISQTVYALALQVYLRPPEGKLLPSPSPFNNIDVEKKQFPYECIALLLKK